MTEHDLDKLLGGFAADTLTPEERRKLYQAALEDQQVFNTLADEQGLKDLLADPTVRRRLLDALKQRDAGSSGSLSWLDWLRRPAGLAFAGGLAVALFALVFGTRIFEQSLKQTSPSAATEETKSNALPAPAPSDHPAAPEPGKAPQGVVRDKAAAVKPEPRQELLADRFPNRERAATSPAAKPLESEPPVREQAKQGPPLKESMQDLAARKAASNEIQGTATAVPEQQPVGGSAPQSAAPAPIPAPSSPAAAGSAAPEVSARTLFYGETSGHRESAERAAGQEAGRHSFADKPRAGRLESTSDGFFGLGKSTAKSAVPTALGLRYSFLQVEADGRAREVDATAVGPSPRALRLTVEANQGAYIQVWKTVADATAQLLLPDKETGKISLKLAAGQRELVTVPGEAGPFSLTIRLSRVPFGPITRQEAILFGRVSQHQLTESVAPGSPSGAQETATYVVNRDASPTAQVSAQILLEP